jgi:drug/metabolite transporter (DMT)-like permease
MTILLCYIFYFFASSFSTLQARWITKKRNLDSREQISFVFQILLFVCVCSLSFPFFSSFYIAGNKLFLLFLFLTCGIAGAGSNIASMIAQKHLDAGVTTLVNNFYTPITIVLSSLLLHEGLTLVQVYGTILLLIALFLVSKKHRIGKFKFDKYFLYMVLGAVFLGILLVAERALQKTTGFSAGIMMSWWGQMIFVGLATFFTKSTNRYKTGEVLYSGFARFLGSLSYVVLVYVADNLSQVASITTFKVVVVFVLGALFLNEREDLPRKILGSAIAVIGLLLMK